MKYSLTPYSQTVTNITEGDIDLTTDEVIVLINTTSAQIEVPVSGTTSGTLVLDCDLGSRIHVDEIQYYFNSPVSGTEIVPYIDFSIKDESFDVYISLATYYNGSYYYATISGTDSPRYVRVYHTVASGYGGLVNGFKVINDDTYVDFGEDGTQTFQGVSLSVEDSIVEIDEMSVFNSGLEKANAKLIIEPQGDVSDNVFSISDSSEGPWYGIYQEDDKITGSDLWETGSQEDLQLVSEVLKLAGGKTEGIYRTRIFKLDDYQRLTFNMMDYDYPSISGIPIIATEDTDTFENIEVKSSNSEPMPRTSYIEMTGNYGNDTKFTQHRWMADGSIAETSDDWGTWGQTSNYWEYWYDSVREDEYIVDKPFYTAGNTAIYFHIRRKNGTVYTSTISNSDYDSDRYYSTYKLSPNTFGGFWIYYFLASGDIDTGIYYLRYYDSGMNLVYDKQATSDQGTFLYDLDSVYNSSGQMWYTDNDLSTVFKIENNGDIAASYLATDDIRGVVSDDEGGCWFIQQQVLIHIDSDANYLSEIELSTATASYVYSNFNGGFWIQDGWIVRYLDSTGTEIFNVEIENLYFIVPTKDGLMTKQHDGSTNITPKASFISTDYRKVTRTWEYPQTEGGYKGTFDYNRYGVRSHLYDDLESDHASNFPISIDTKWNSVDWTTVSLRDYNFTNDQYHQIRFTLRADNSANSPEVYGLYTQRAIEIPDVYPGNYGRFYLKSELDGVNSGDAGNYTSNIRAYWFLSVE